VRGRGRNLRARLEGGTAGAVRYVGRIGKIALDFEQGPWDGVEGAKRLMKDVQAAL